MVNFQLCNLLDVWSWDVTMHPDPVTTRIIHHVFGKEAMYSIFIFSWHARKKNRSKYLIIYHLYTLDATLPASLLSQFQAAIEIPICSIYINNVHSFLDIQTTYISHLTPSSFIRSSQRGTEKPDFEVTSPPRSIATQFAQLTDGERLDFLIETSLYAKTIHGTIAYLPYMYSWFFMVNCR